MRMRVDPVRLVLGLGFLGAVLAVASLVWPQPAPGRAVAWVLVFVLPLYAVGLLACRLRPDLAVARALGVAASAWVVYTTVNTFAFGLAETSPGDYVSWLAVLAATLGAIAVVAATAFILTFPAGRPGHRLEWILIVAVAALAAARLLLLLLTEPTLAIDVEHSRTTAQNPLDVAGSPFLTDVVDGLDAVLGNAFAAAVVVLVLRYRRSDDVTRRQIRWLLTVPLIALGLFALGTLLDWAGVSWAWVVAGDVGQYVALGAVPVVLLVAIVRHRLLDVDVVIRRSLVYGVLWALIGLAYVVAATGVGLAGSQRLPVVLAVLVTVAATIAFAPLRTRLERWADRRAFGSRLEGYELLAQLGRGLESTRNRQALLQQIADAVVAGLRVRWCEVHLAAEADLARAGQARQAAAAELEAAMVHADQVLGVIECGPRHHGATSEEDRLVLDTLARQAALAVHNAQLSARLEAQVRQVRQQAAELAASRARIVVAGDAERRRIERDLHDGAQQQVVALMTTIGRVRNQLARDPDRAVALLDELEREAGALHADLIELTRGIHPAVLSDHGLVEAIRSRAQRLPLQVRVRESSPVGRLPADVEGAAYFVCSEALTNVLKHAGDTEVLVSLTRDDCWLTLEVSDTGRGFNGTAGAGTGLANMADRAAAVGGDLEVLSRPGRGTTVHTQLPLAREGAGAGDG